MVLIGAKAYSMRPWRQALHCDAHPKSVDPSLARAINAHGLQPYKKPEQTTKGLVLQLVKELEPDWMLLAFTAATAIATAAVSLAIPAATGELVNVLVEITKRLPEPVTAVATSTNFVQQLFGNTQMNVAAIKLSSLFLANSALTFAYVAMVSQVGENLAARLRVRLFKSIVVQDILFFDERKCGDLLNRLTADVQNFKSSVKSTISQGLKALTQTVGGITSLYIMSPQLTLFMCATLPALYGVGSLYGRFLRSVSESAREADAWSTSIANEALSNIRTVRAFAMEDIEVDRYSDAVDDANSKHRYLGFHIGMFQGLNALSISGMFVSVLYFGGYLVNNGSLSPSKLMNYLMSTQNTQRALATLVVLYGSVTKALGAGVRVFEYMDLPALVSVRGGRQLDHIDGEIVFHNIQFAYPSRPERIVLESFNLTVPKGKIVALVGQSGGGKSTIAALLERFYEPLGGEILLDGHKLSDLDPSWLRTSIGYINQEPALFAGTVLENIRYGLPTATDEQVYEAARLANADKFISHFPAGYETVVGERGVTLSGGQRQRIAIARALLKNPRILLLDEATSALDAESERLVQEALDHLMKNRTVLVIAHRLSTIHNADVICVLDKDGGGRIVEKGNHHQLMALNGVYATLYKQSFAGHK